MSLYDSERFFEKYAGMARSRLGLAGAGEWPALKKLLPDFGGARVLDLGCGYGWHCAYAARQGAKSVVGVDGSHRMIERARGINAHAAIEYRVADIVSLRFDENSFDAVISSLVLHYLEDIGPLFRRVFSWLRAGGRFVFTVEHPVFTAEGSQQWVLDERGQIAHFPVDNYYLEGRREAVFLGERVVKHHRTLTTYFRALTGAGFAVRDLVEPAPPEDMLEQPGMRDELRRPMMLIFSAEKPG